jgi:hypothetical protein
MLQEGSTEAQRPDGRVRTVTTAIDEAEIQRILSLVQAAHERAAAAEAEAARLQAMLDAVLAERDGGAPEQRRHEQLVD